MTSTLKVDQIQLADGSVPKAGDLGLNVSGSVLAVHTLQGQSSDFSVTSGNWVDLDTFSITTQGNSRLIWFMDTQQYIKSIANTNPSFQLVVDGVVAGSQNSANNARWFHNWYGQNAGREVQFNYFATDVLSSGSHTCKIQTNRYNSGTITLGFQSCPQRYLVQEIAG